MDTAGPVIVLVLLWAGFFGGIGALIGSSKDRGGAGFWLGSFLGVIGWIIVAVMSRTPEKQAEYEAKVAAASGRVSAPAPQPGQWAPDPFGRHDHRFFNGTAWTDKVSDAGQVGVDAPTFPLPADSASGEGWAPDPYGRYPQRFYKSSGWTAHVARDGTTFADPADFPPPQQLGTMPPPPT